MTMVVFTYILNAKIGFGLSMQISYIVAAIGTIALSEHLLALYTSPKTQFLNQSMTRPSTQLNDVNSRWPPLHRTPDLLKVGGSHIA